MLHLRVRRGLPQRADQVLTLCVCNRYLFVKASKITSDLKHIADEFAGARVELFQITTPTALTPDAMGFDQFGQPAQSMFGQTEHSAGQLKPCWPPLGYNIILKAPKSFDLRASWPKTSTTGGIMMQPVAMMAQPAVVQAEMVRDDAPKDDT